MNTKHLTVGLLVVIAGLLIYIIISPNDNFPYGQHMYENRESFSDTDTRGFGMGMGGPMMMHNDFVNSDEEFLLQMIPHHQEAVDTAKGVLERGGEIEVVKTLVQNIITAQEKEIADMKKWYLEWYGKEYADDGSYDHMMRDLSSYSGRDLDLIFTNDMIMHHMGAIHMAINVLDFTEREELKTLGNNILQTQRQEIFLMQEILAKNR
jgi:uncharacterized protein (DUF305 family)